MSTLTSSAINKSGKTVAPKGVARRRPAAARPAVTQSQTDPRSDAPAAETTKESSSTEVASQPANEPRSTEASAPAARQAPTPPPTQQVESHSEQTAANALVTQNQDDTTQERARAEDSPPVTQPTPTQTQTPLEHNPAQDLPSEVPVAGTTEIQDRRSEETQQAQQGTNEQSETQESPAAAPPTSIPTPAPTQDAGNETSNQAQALLDAAETEDAPIEETAADRKRRAGPKPKAGVKRRRNQPAVSTEKEQAKDNASIVQPSTVQPPIERPSTEQSPAEQPPTEQPTIEQPQTVQSSEDIQPEVSNVERAIEQLQEDGRQAAPGKPPRKKQKKQQLSDERIAAEDDDSVPTTGTQAAPKPKKPRAPRKRKEAPKDGAGDGTEKGADATALGKRKKRRNKKGDVVETNGELPVEEGQEQAQEQEDPELHEIDVNVTTMNELTKDRGLGKSSERGRKMAEIDWAEVARKRREEPLPVSPTDKEKDVTQNEGDEQEGDEATPGTQNNFRGLQLRMVNGEMILDEDSARIDRQAEAVEEAARRAQFNPDDDLTKKVTRMSWIEKKKRDPAERVPAYKMKSDPWNDEETDRFYDALRMFGTDFFIISKMFPPKTRRQIKLKFVREERLDPERVNLALSGLTSVPMDLEVYAEATGNDVNAFRDPRELDEELEREGQEQRVEIEKRRIEATEAQKQRDIQMETREKEQEENNRIKQAQKEQRAMARRRRKGQQIGTGTF